MIFGISMHAEVIVILKKLSEIKIINYQFFRFTFIVIITHWGKGNSQIMN